MRLSDWYAVYTRSQCEQKVAAELTRREVENFLPCFKRTRRWADRTKVIEVPVFRGYVFVRYADVSHGPWPPASSRTVLTIPGVVRMISEQGFPVGVPESEIDAIRLMIQHPEVKPAIATPVRGATVRVLRGPLAGLEGVCDRIKGRCRVVVAIEMLGKAVSAEFNAEDLQVLAPHLRQA
jgi:transcription antitermination factor NusG